MRVQSCMATRRIKRQKIELDDQGAHKEQTFYGGQHAVVEGNTANEGGYLKFVEIGSY